MNFRDFYQDGVCRYSFEIFPPKGPEGIAGLLEALRELAIFDPAFISCTYGAMGSTQELTRDLVIRIQRELHLTAAFHFTCVGSGRANIKSYVESLRQEGLGLIVALRGDPPQGMDQFVKPDDGFAHANDLVAYLREIGGFSLAVAGYPEGHIECVDKQTDLLHLKRKVDAGADVVITQLFFDNHDFYDFVDRARKIGIQVPIIPGIMPIVNLKQVEKITRMCGAKMPQVLHQKLLAHQEDGEVVRQLGIEHAAQQCQDLIRHKAAGIHFYTLNKAYSVKRVLQAL